MPPIKTASGEDESGCINPGAGMVLLPRRSLRSKSGSPVEDWFLDPQTRMNPNLQYAQAIPGINNGRGIGIIDSRALVEVVDAIALLQSSAVLSEKDVSALKQWFGEYYHWMTTSQNGFEEDNWHNNHGSYFDMQAVTFALFSGKTDEAKQRLYSPSYGALPVNLISKAVRWPSWSVRGPALQ